jgi:colanic acid/amylovoran biosynthesis protein
MDILIVNVHSALNLGDDAIMYTTIQSIQHRYPGAKIVVSANDPDSWAKYTDIEICHAICTWIADCRLGLWRKRFYLMPFVLLFLCLSAILYRFFSTRLNLGSSDKSKLLDAYYDADLVLSCGGGNFYAHGPLSPGFVWNIVTVGFAVGLNKRIVMLPQSIGPIEHWWQRLLARVVLNRVGIIMTREQESERFILSTLKLAKPPILVPDLAFGLPSVDEQSPVRISEDSNQLRVGFTIIDRKAQNPNFLDQATYEDAICSLITKLDREYSAEIFLIIQSYGPSEDQDDRNITNRIYKRMQNHISNIFILDNFNCALEIKSTIKALDFVIGTRMHTGIFALSNSIPVILIGYQPKACGMMKLFGLPEYCCDMEKVNIETLELLIDDLNKNLDKLKQEISTKYLETQVTLSNWVSYLDTES